MRNTGFQVASYTRVYVCTDLIIHLQPDVVDVTGSKGMFRDVLRLISLVCLLSTMKTIEGCFAYCQVKQVEQGLEHWQYRALKTLSTIQHSTHPVECWYKPRTAKTGHV